MKRQPSESWPDLEAENYFGVGPSDGLLVVYAPPERRQKLIVFVHGLGGDRFHTWGHMPRFLFEDFGADGVDIGLAGYRSGHRRLFRPDTASFKETAASLAGELKDSGYREVLLFGHSLGGLVCRQTIRHLNDIGELNPDDGPRIVGSISFASPFAGTTKSSFPIRLVHPEARLLAAFSDTTTELKTFWAAQVEGKNPKVDLEVFAAWAQYDKLVRKASAIDGVDHANTKEATGHDHSSLVKPADSSDALYEWVYGRVRDIFFEPGPTDREIEAVHTEAAERSRSAAAAAGGAAAAGAAAAGAGVPTGQGDSDAGASDGQGRQGPGSGDGRPAEFRDRASKDLQVPAVASKGAGGGARRLLVGLVILAAIVAGTFMAMALLGDSSDQATEPDPVPVATATAAPEPLATATAAPEPTATAAPEPTATAAPEPTPTAEPEPTPTAEPEPEPTPDLPPTSGSETAAAVPVPGGLRLELIEPLQAAEPDSATVADANAVASIEAAAVALASLSDDATLTIDVPDGLEVTPERLCELDAAGCLQMVLIQADGEAIVLADFFQLALTGADPGSLAVVGSALIGAGALMVSFARQASRADGRPSRRGSAARR